MPKIYFLLKTNRIFRRYFKKHSSTDHILKNFSRTNLPSYQNSYPIGFIIRIPEGIVKTLTIY